MGGVGGRSVDARGESGVEKNPGGLPRLADYLLHRPFALKKITWNAATKDVILYHSKRHHSIRRNFQAI